MGPRVRLGLAALAVLLSAADTYVVILALPDMMAGVGVGLDELQRGAAIVTGFLLGYVMALPLAGRVSDATGRVPVIVACLLVFALGSLVTASAGDLTIAVTGRALQGLGAGGLVPPALALVADTWSDHRRRSVGVGLIGAAQELGSVTGPLLGALVLAAAGWRAIFWVNLAAGLLLALALALDTVRRRPRVRDLAAVAAAGVAAVCLTFALRPPAWLATDVVLGAALVPLIEGGGWSGGWSSPLGLAAIATAVLAVILGPTRDVTRVLAGLDWLGAVLLALALAGVVVTFAGAEVNRSAVDERWPWLMGGSLLALGGFAWRQARHRDPLVPARAVAARGAWGSLTVNALVGASLVAVLVNVPLFARLTRHPDSQLAAALVLLQFLVALPVGAVAGGLMSRRFALRWVAAAGLAAAAGALAVMATWDARALYGSASTVALVVAGLGLGLAVAPVTTVMLSATPPDVHGLASALTVLTRTMGMLVGLSALTAVGLRVFYRRQAAAGSPLELCPDSPADCPAYTAATQASLLAEQQVVFLGAAVCALAAAGLAAALLSLPGGRARRRGHDTPFSTPPTWP